MNPTQDGDGRVFYSLNCTFWTEDWRRMGFNKIPVCPNCGSPGFEDSFTSFLDKAKNYKDERLGKNYFYFIIWLKNRCYLQIENARFIFNEFLKLDEQYK